MSFSAHCDFLQTSEFIDLVQPQYIVLVHGEKTQMSRLHDALKRKYKQLEQSAEKKGENDPSSLVVWKPQVMGSMLFFFFCFFFRLFNVCGKEIYTPENCHLVEIAFASQEKVRVVGSLAEMVPGIGHSVRGVLVKKDFEATLMDVQDLPTYTDLVSTQVR